MHKIVSGQCKMKKQSKDIIEKSNLYSMKNATEWLVTFNIRSSSPKISFSVHAPSVTYANSLSLGG